MSSRQHVWVSAEATSFQAPCEACLARRAAPLGTSYLSLVPVPALVEGTLRSDADVGFTTCQRGHRVVVRRLGRSRWQPLGL